MSEAMSSREHTITERILSIVLASLDFLGQLCAYGVRSWHASQRCKTRLQGHVNGTNSQALSMEDRPSIVIM
jgi:hypothetical protein